MKRSTRQRTASSREAALSTSATNSPHASPPTKRPAPVPATEPVETAPEGEVVHVETVAASVERDPSLQPQRIVVMAQRTASPRRVAKTQGGSFPDGYKATILNPAPGWRGATRSQPVTTTFVATTTTSTPVVGGETYFYEDQAQAAEATEPSYDESAEGSSSRVVVKTDVNEDTVEQEIVVDDQTEAPKKARKARRRPAPQVRLPEEAKAGDEVPAEGGDVYTYQVVEADGETIVVDDDGQPAEYNLYEEPYHEEVNSLFMLGGEIAKHPWVSNDEINHFFVANPSLSSQIDVRELASLTKTVSPEGNFQLIIGLAGLVNSMKRDMASLKMEVTSLREMVSNKEDLGNTKRRFSTHNDVRHPWRIASVPPLREVDLVATAHTMDFTRGTKKSLSNKDAITRFVKTVLELLIPEEYTRQYTVRERSQRRNGLKDIGEHAKNQIIGCVLDLLGLYEVAGLTDQDRADRVHFTNLVNHSMRMALIDLRRSEPRRILTPNFVQSQVAGFE
uniref:Reverse transcriptase domain-containing protein n=1 Tax=Panagrellus redivivus TaxID=6233 RepID=A0A7E4V9Z8_PANRE